MKTEITRIQAAFKYNWQGPMWYGGNVNATLAGIEGDVAFKQAGAGSHNIYELVAHMLCWRRFVLELLNGNVDYKVEINSETDWPHIYDRTEMSWNRLVNEMEQSQQLLVNALQNFDEAKLDEIVPGREFTWYMLLHGLIHHDIYHSGQIAILKK
jgi:uncharacterized damage-inducible protein DinB